MTPKSIILTGASRGIGLAIAHFLLKAKHNVFLVARTAAPMEKLKEQYKGQVEFLAADLGDFENGSKVITLALTAFSKLDALILNHGTLVPVKRIADSTPEEWRSLFDVNFFSAVAFIQPAISHLRRTSGRIILVSSGAAIGAYSTWGPYGSSKAALNHLGLTLSVEEPDITTVSIRPGAVDTAMQGVVREHASVMDRKDAEKLVGLFKSGALLRPEQPGDVIARLSLEAEHGLSGRFLSWESVELKKYQS